MCTDTTYYTPGYNPAGLRCAASTCSTPLNLSLVRQMSRDFDGTFFVPYTPPCMCQMGYFAATGTKCLPCPGETSAPFGVAQSSGECGCPANFYLDTRAGRVICSPCPQGSTSPPGSTYAGCTVAAALSAQIAQGIATETAATAASTATLGGLLGAVIVLLAGAIAVLLVRSKAASAAPTSLVRQPLAGQGVDGEEAEGGRAATVPNPVLQHGAVSSGSTGSSGGSGAGAAAPLWWQPLAKSMWPSSKGIFEAKL